MSEIGRKAKVKVKQKNDQNQDQGRHDIAQRTDGMAGSKRLPSDAIAGKMIDPGTIVGMSVLN